MGTPADSEKTKAAIVDAAGPLFADAGFAGVSARRVAKHAGVSLSAIPYHFGSMERLYEAVLRRALTLSTDDEVLAGRALAAEDPREGLRLAIAMIVADYLEPLAPWPHRLMQREQLDPSPVYRELVEQRLGPHYDWLRRILGRAVGRTPDDDAVHLGAATIYAQADTLLTRRWMLEDYAPAVLRAIDERARFVEIVLELALAAVEVHDRVATARGSHSRNGGRGRR
jgi:AcrR family transcriptional regulator